MVATDEHSPQLTCPLSDFIGIGAVAYDITQIKDTIMRGRSLQTGVQRFQVRMYVRDDKYAHANL